jgi:hypothetical protein
MGTRLFFINEPADKDRRAGDSLSLVRRSLPGMLMAASLRLTV